MPIAHTSDIIEPSIVGKSAHSTTTYTEYLSSFPMYTNTLTMMRSNRARLQLRKVSCTSHVTKH